MISDLTRVTVVVMAPPQLIVANRMRMKAILLAELGLGSDVILDLRGTVCVDSSALGMLLTVTTAFTRAGRSFVLCELQNGLPDLFGLTQVDRRIRIGRTLEDARGMLDLPPLVMPASGERMAPLMHR